MDLVALARERVQVGPAADWIVPCPYDADFKPEVRGPITELLIERQDHAELHQMYVRHAVRLETMQAVQHQSQWRLEFEPQTQTLILHSIKTRRGAVETEHAATDRIRFLQREAELEGFIIDGWVTLLLLLEDVRPGDILEWSYTLTNRPRLLPENIASFFMLPSGVSIGKYHFSIRHAEQRRLKWSSSAPDFTPAIETAGAEIRRFWQGENLSTPEPEEGTPSWKIDAPWIQFSDCADWQTVAHAVIAAWKEEPPGEGLVKLVEDVTKTGLDVPARVNRAVELVQDQFRYLSVNLELGGQIPAPAETVIRRRYGDCKDLAFLLVRLLRALGIVARPVLVNAHWCESISALLPSPGIFNHCIVEYEIGDEKRWVDATLNLQGGGALKRPVRNFGLGLPIDTNTTGLAPAPKGSLAPNTYEIKETFIIDTTGFPSYFAVQVTARGAAAESLRQDFDNNGVDAIARNTLLNCTNRFSKAVRVGQLEYRDDRELNEFTMAEAFEIDKFLLNEPNGFTCTFFIQSDPTTVMLACPPIAGPRRNPLALPFPCRRDHTIEIHFARVDRTALPPFDTSTEYFKFSRRSKASATFMQVTFSLETLSDSIPPDHVSEHRVKVENVWKEAGIHFRWPLGHKRMEKTSEFGALPDPSLTRANVPIVERPAAKVAVAPVFVDGTPSPEGRRRRRRSHGSSRHGNGRNPLGQLSFWTFLGSFFLLGISYPVAEKSFGIAALLGFLASLGWVASLILAVWAWRRCATQPDKYWEGRGWAQATLALAALMGLCMAPPFITGFIAGLNDGRPGPRSSAEVLNFEPYHFTFRMPPQPWTQTDARVYGAGTLLAFMRPEPMFCKVNYKRMDTALPDIRARVVAECKENLRQQATSFEVISEKEVTHNGIAGWQVESRTIIQGRNFYTVQWMFASNGFGYQLEVWGRSDHASDVKKEASAMFDNFELLQ